MEYYEQVVIGSPPQSEGCFCFEVGLNLGAHTHDRSHL